MTDLSTFAALDIAPEAIESYLASAGWELIERDPGVFTVWRREREGDRIDVLVPLDRTFHDYQRRLTEALATLGSLEGVGRGEELLSLFATASSDIVSIRAIQNTSVDGSIPYDEAEALLEGSRELLVAAALSTVEARASYGARKPDRVTAFSERLRFGQTERGSFVINVVSRLPERTRPPTDLAMPGMEPVPFERQVTTTLASALAATHDAMQSGQTSSFVTSIPRGVSADLCDALIELIDHDGVSGLAFGFKWARRLPLHMPTPPAVTIDRENVPMLVKASNALRPVETFHDYALTGTVRSLVRGAVDPAGVITVEGRLGGNPRRVRVQLHPVEYSVAIRAHESQRPVLVRGNFEREGRYYWGREISEFRVYGDA